MGAATTISVLSPKLQRILDEVPYDSLVYVITFLGSMNPVTNAHIDCVVQTHRLLSDTSSPLHPSALPQAGAVVGLISVNSDSWIEHKLAREGLGEHTIPQADRLALIDMAIQEYDWLDTCLLQDAWLHHAKKTYQAKNLKFIQYEVDGADVALRDCTWKYCSETHRYVAIGRTGLGDRDEIRSRVDASGSRQEELNRGWFIVGPDLANMSSTRVRQLLRARDTEALEELGLMMHRDVLQWMLDRGPYQPDAIQ